MVHLSEGCLFSKDSRLFLFFTSLQPAISCIYTSHSQVPKRLTTSYKSPLRHPFKGWQCKWPQLMDGPDSGHKTSIGCVSSWLFLGHGMCPVPGNEKHGGLSGFSVLRSLQPWITAQHHRRVCTLRVQLLQAARWPFSVLDRAQGLCGRARNWTDSQWWMEDGQLLSISTARWNPGTADQPSASWPWHHPPC